MHPLKHRSLIDLIDDDNSTSFNFVQFEKVDGPISMTDDGIVIFISDEHILKADSLISDEGIKTFDNDKHPSKDLIPIEVTELGIKISVNFVQFLKQFIPISISCCDNKRFIISKLFFSAETCKAVL